MSRRKQGVLVPCTLALCLIPACTFAQRPAESPGDRGTAAARASADAEQRKQAEALLEKGDFKAAEVVLRSLSARNPGDARLQFDLGFTEEHNGEDEAAAQSYAAVIAADPQMAEPHVALGLLEARLGHDDRARPPLEAAVNLGTASPQLRGRALRALARLNESRDPGEAADDLLRAAQLTGEQLGDAELSASLARQAGSADDAEAAYRRILAQDPANLPAIVGLGSLLRTGGKLAECDALLRPALAAHPDDAQLAAQVAALDAAENKLPEAIRLLSDLRKRDERAAADPALTQMLAHLELVSGDGAAALPLYESLAAAAPQDPQLLDDLGSALVRQQHFAEAQAVLARAVGLRASFHDDAAWGETAGHLAFAASRNHDPNGALQALAARATVLPNSPATLFLEATAHDALHQNKLAEQSYRAFLAMAKGKLPNEEFEARHRLVTLEHEH